MRARYSAFVLKKPEYIVETTHPSARDETDLEEIAAWSEGVEWTGFEVVASQVDGNTGTVEFVAHYREDGELQQHHEVAQFAREDGDWYYMDGEAPTPPAMRVVVVGSGFGMLWADAIKKAANLTLVGILGRGSPRSERLAELHEVKLYRSVEELPEVDLAVLAVFPSRQREIAPQLTAKGVHLIAEHPIGPEVAGELLQAAAETQTAFHINAHFGDTPTSLEFLRECEKHRAEGPPTLITAFSAPRTLFGVLDIVGRACGGIDSVRGFDKDVSSTGLKAVAGEINGIPVLLNGTTFVNEVDDGSDVAIYTRVTVGFESGTLTLLDFMGPTVWIGRGVGATSSVIASQDQHGIWSLRKKALLHAILRLQEELDSGSHPLEQDPTYLRELCTLHEKVRPLLDP